MVADDTLAKALADVRQRKTDLQADFERITAELNKLRAAEKSLAAIVEGAAPEETSGFDGHAAAREANSRPRRSTGRGSRGPRANSAKGRLKALLEETGPQGLSHAEIERRLPDVAPNTLNTYLSMMVTGGEAVRRGEFYIAAAPPTGEEALSEDTRHEAEPEEQDETIE